MNMPGALFRIEAIKATRRRAFWVAFGVFFALFLFDVVNAVQIATERPNVPYALPESWPRILAMPSFFGPFLLGILLILLVAPEFSWRTGRQNVIDGLSKERFYAGKLLVAGVLVALLVVLPIVIGGIGATISPSEGGPAIVRKLDASLMAGYALALLMWGSAALMLASLVRSAGPAMGALVLYVLIEGFVGEVVGRVSRTLETVIEFFPLAISQALVEPLAHYPDMLAAENAQRAARGQDALEFLAIEVLIIAALVFAAGFLAAGFFSVKRRDL